MLIWKRNLSVLVRYRRNYYETPGNVWQIENVVVVRSIVRDIDPVLRKFQGQTCAKVDATRSSSQLLAADSTKIWHTVLLTSSWVVVIVLCVVAFQSIIEDASPSRHIESERRSRERHSVLFTDPFLFSEHFQAKVIFQE